MPVIDMLGPPNSTMLTCELHVTHMLKQEQGHIVGSAPKVAFLDYQHLQCLYREWRRSPCVIKDGSAVAY